MTVFTKSEYEHLHSLVFRDDYPGYKPGVVELPNGDGKADTEKRYAHVALKYLQAIKPVVVPGLTYETSAYVRLGCYLHKAHDVACQMAEAVGVPKLYWPDIRYGALRVLEYPIGATSAPHTDFDLFTVMCYRDQPEKFSPHRHGLSVWHKNTERWMQHINRQSHIGEIGELVDLGPATRHEVLPSTTVQHSVVYFAIPDHAAVLPSGVTVGAWIEERTARSRSYR